MVYRRRRRSRFSRVRKRTPSRRRRYVKRRRVMRTRYPKTLGRRRPRRVARYIKGNNAGPFRGLSMNPNRKLVTLNTNFNYVLVNSPAGSVTKESFWMNNPFEPMFYYASLATPHVNSPRPAGLTEIAAPRS